MLHKRLIQTAGVFALCVSVLAARLAWLTGSERLAEAAARQTSYTLSAGESRGSITDRNGEPLVEEETAELAAVPPDSPGLPALLSLLSDTERRRVQSAAAEGKPVLARLQKGADTSALPEDILLLTTPVRYGEGQLAAHLIGYTDSEGHGVAGLEKSYDDLLYHSGEETRVTFYSDGVGRLLAVQPQVTVTAETAELRLTIDKTIQRIAEEEGGAIKKGAIVVMEPQTGELLASVSLPGYSPDRLAESLSDPAAPLVNRAFSAYAVGSVFKTVTAAAACIAGEEGLFYTCTGSITVENRAFHCHQTAGHGALDLTAALRESCNPYFIALGERVGGTLLLRTASDLSFGKSFRLAPGLETAAGLLPQEEPAPAGLANLSFGQGELSATPIQLALMTSAVVNGGKTPIPMLVAGITDGEGSFIPSERQPPVLALTQKQAETIRLALVAAIAENENALARSERVTVGGKTGTAQTGQYDENGNELCNGWFVGFFPAESPRYVVSVLCEESESGNKDAAPVFRRIAERITAAEKS